MSPWCGSFLWSRSPARPNRPRGRRRKTGEVERRRSHGGEEWEGRGRGGLAANVCFNLGRKTCAERTSNIEDQTLNIEGRTADTLV